MFVLRISRPPSNMGHVGSKTRSPGQILGNSCLHSRGQIGDPILMKLDQNVCLGQVKIWVTLNQQVGHQVKSQKSLVNNLQATFVTGILLILVRMFVLTVSRQSSNMNHEGLTNQVKSQTIIVYTSKAKAFKFEPLVQLSLWN